MYQTKKNMFIKRDKTNVMIIFMSLSSFVSNMLTIISGLLVAKWITPEVLGKFSSYTIYSSYIILAQIGIPIALGRELPLHVGRGNVKDAELYAKVSQYFAIILCVTAVFLTVLVALYYCIIGNYQAAAGLLVIGILVFDGFYVTQYLKVLYRGTQDFNKLSIIGLVTAFTSFISIYFVYEFGFYGLCLRALLSTLVGFSLTYYWRPTRVKPKFEKQAFLHLLKLGFPMYLVTNVYSLWPTLQKTVILLLGGPISLGYYMIANVVESGLASVSGSIGGVTYATMANQWGQGKNLEQLFKLALKPVVLGALLFAVVIPIGWMVLPYFVTQLMPNYTGGIVAAQWMMVAGFISLFNVWTNIYNVVNHQKHKLYSFLCGMAGWLLSLGLLYNLKGFSLEIFPQAMAVGFFVILVYNLLYVKKHRFLKYE